MGFRAVQARLLGARVRLMKAFGLFKDLKRPSSFPFISGDTYRAIADVVIDSEAAAAAFIGRSSQDSGSFRVVFCAADFAALLLGRLPDSVSQRCILVIHNGDLIPVDAVVTHSPRFARIFCVNWLGPRDVALPIPIGIENSWRRMNGQLFLFEDCLPPARPAGSADRDIDVLVAFNVKTCPEVRGEARETFRALANRSDLNVVEPERLVPTEYHQLLRRSRFVLSPRGNGVDCHRTWEAMYRGAVPVVLKSHWPFASDRYPVLVVDSWAEAAQRIAQDPSGTYQEVVAGADRGFYALDFLAVVRGTMLSTESER